MKIIQFIFCFLLTAIVLVAGCATQKPTPDPLTGWKILGGNHYDKIDKSIVDDYQDYIRKLPAEESYYAKGSAVWFFEDGTGQHAVKIEIPLNGAYSEHVLFYDKNNIRTKVII